MGILPTQQRFESSHVGVREFGSTQLHTEVEAFYVHHTDGTATGMHYHLPTLSLVLRALLVAGIDPLRSEITRLVRLVISEQQKDGYWADETTHGKIPIWATMYACLALREFSSRVDAVHETLDIRQSIVELTDAVRETQTHTELMLQRLTKVESQVKPVSGALGFIRRYRVFWALLLAVAVYTFFLFRVDIPLYVNIASGILAVVLFLIGSYDARQQSKKDE